LAEGIGGLLAGAALVLLVRSLLKKRATSTPAAGAPETDTAQAPK
jgi:hypothetical protein